MATFLGTYRMTMSRAGRVRMPAKYRRVIAALSEPAPAGYPLVLAAAKRHTVALVPEAGLEAARRNEPDRFTDTWLVWMRPDGAFQLPPRLKEHVNGGAASGSTIKMVFVGLDDVIELMSGGNFEAVERDQAAVLKRELDSLKRFGI